MLSSSSLLSHSPSFNSYSSSDKLTQIAARVVQEFQHDDDSLDLDDDVLLHDHCDQHHFAEEEEEEEEADKNNHEDDDDEFEFSFVSREPDLSPIPADEIFYNGQIRPVYPLFNTELLFAEDVKVIHKNNSVPSPTTMPEPKPSVRLPLGRLFIEERERDSASSNSNSNSCSSSEADELDGVPAGTYCVWTPNKAAIEAAQESDRCKKSNSTGTSKRWKIRDLLHRSNSDGKDTFVFLTPPSIKKKPEGTTVEKSVNQETAKISGNVKPKGSVGSGKEMTATALKNGTAKENDRRRTYLPYKKDLVGLFSNVNGVSRNIHPF